MPAAASRRGTRVRQQSTHVTAVVRRSPAHRGTVVAVADLTPRMRRVTVRRARRWSALTIRPAQDVELLLSEDSGRRVKRRYTIRARPSGRRRARPRRPCCTATGPVRAGRERLRPATSSSSRARAASSSSASAAGTCSSATSRHCRRSPRSARRCPPMSRRWRSSRSATPRDELPVPAGEVSWVHRRDGPPPGTPSCWRAALAPRPAGRRRAGLPAGRDPGDGRAAGGARGPRRRCTTRSS